jgi:hypothetical protein
MSIPKGYVRGFYHLKAAWYGSANLKDDGRKVDEIQIGLYADDGGGTKGEFSVRFVKLQGDIALELRAFQDAWFVLNEYFGDLIPRLAELKESKDLDGEALCKVLLDMGLKDLTPRVRPSH